MSDPHELSKVDWSTILALMPKCVRDDFAKQRAYRNRRGIIEGYDLEQERTWLGHLATSLELAEYRASIHRVQAE